MAQNQTAQMKEWSADFGREYTDRNPQSPEEMDSLYLEQFGLTRSGLNKEFLGDLDRSLRILEVGSNVGTQLRFLQQMGFKNLYGLELQSYAVEVSKSKTKGINLIQGSAFDIPYKDGFFDLVYTSGVLIHISPAEIEIALDEIYRCTSKLIWGFEYYAEKYSSVPYRGRNDLLWKTDFAKLYTDRFPDFKIVKEKKVKYLSSKNIDKMYLLSNS